MTVCLRPFNNDEAYLFYSVCDDLKDAALGTIGHLRADFGGSGKEFYTSWWPHNGDRFNSTEFRAELLALLNELRRFGPLRDFEALREYCGAHQDGKLPDHGRNGYGFISETDNFRFCLRCTPVRKDYQVYVYAYDLDHQRERERAVERLKLLLSRLDENLLSRAGGIGTGFTVLDIHELGRFIAMHEYLTREHRFSESEVNRLLRFQNPLETATECVSLDSGTRCVDLNFQLDRADAELYFPLAIGEDTLNQKPDAQ